MKITVKTKQKAKAIEPFDIDPWLDTTEPIAAKQPFEPFSTTIRPLFHPQIVNLRFVWGGSSLPNTDCVGLVIAFLRYHGFSCPWEAEIPRHLREYTESRDHMIARGFVPDPIGNIFLLDIHPYAHIGFIERGIAYHQTLAGLRSQQTVGIVDRFRYEGA
jgi:hypothetical protein